MTLLVGKQRHNPASSNRYDNEVFKANHRNNEDYLEVTGKNAIRMDSLSCSAMYTQHLFVESVQVVESIEHSFVLNASVGTDNYIWLFLRPRWFCGTSAKVTTYVHAIVFYEALWQLRVIELDF